MENATEALLIAAGVLIGILILTLGVYLFSTFGGHAANIQTQVDENKLVQFNNEFFKYDGLTDLNIQDVISVKNYALEINKEYNGYYNYETDRASNNNEYVDVFYDDNAGPERLAFKENDEELLKQAIDKKFSCKVEINSTTGRVNKISFFEVKN